MKYVIGLVAACAVGVVLARTLGAEEPPTEQVVNEHRQATREAEELLMRVGGELAALKAFGEYQAEVLKFGAVLMAKGGGKPVDPHEYFDRDRTADLEVLEAKLLLARTETAAQFYLDRMRRLQEAKEQLSRAQQAPQEPREAGK